MSYQEIWETLSKVDVSEHIEKKNGLSFLSWAWAWGTLMEHYPQATYKFKKPVSFPDGSMEVGVTITIDECSRFMWLPVMDYKNTAIANPNARQISDNKMRCLVKCIAMFGLGHYIYAGEDLPATSPMTHTPEQKSRFDLYFNNQDALRFFLFIKSLPEEVYTSLYNSFESGKKVEGKKIAGQLERDGQIEAQDIVDTVTEMLAGEVDPAWREEMEGLEKDEKKVLAGMFDKETLKIMEGLK